MTRQDTIQSFLDWCWTKRTELSRNEWIALEDALHQIEQWVPQWLDENQSIVTDFDTDRPGPTQVNGDSHWSSYLE